MTKKDLKNTRQFKEAMKRTEQARKDGKSIVYAYTNNVPLFWCVQFEISTLDLLTYCYIRDCTKNMKENAFTGSVKGLCARFNTSLPTQRKSLDILETKGFIRKTTSPRGQAQWVRYTDALSRWWSKEDGRPLESILETTAYLNAQERERRAKERGINN